VVDDPVTAHVPVPDAAALRAAVMEVEQHASGSGWDQPGRLFALVPTAELAAAEPALAAQLGIVDATKTPLTPVEQDLDDVAQSLEGLLPGIVWPSAVVGALAVVERVVLPPEVEAAVPADPEEAARFAAEHPEREDVRIAVGVLRGGGSHCVIRLRSHDRDEDLIHGATVVPDLVEALRETLDADHAAETEGAR
jgi:hypothetical protein